MTDGRPVMLRRAPTLSYRVTGMSRLMCLVLRHRSGAGEKLFSNVRTCTVAGGGEIDFNGYVLAGGGEIDFNGYN